MKKVYILAALIGSYMILAGNEGCDQGDGQTDSRCARCNDGSDYEGSLCSAACSGNGGVAFYYDKCTFCGE